MGVCKFTQDRDAVVGCLKIRNSNPIMNKQFEALYVFEAIILGFPKYFGNK